MNKRPSKKEVTLWSLALPGFGQLLNGKLIKGIVLISLEILVNIQSNLNLAVMYSFLGKINHAIAVTDYQWLMFYPCLYSFAVWDAYRDAKGETKQYAFFPFVFPAYVMTIGVMYSDHWTFFGYYAGPILLPVILAVPGILIGLAFKHLLDWFSR